VVTLGAWLIKGLFDMRKRPASLVEAWRCAYSNKCQRDFDLPATQQLTIGVDSFVEADFGLDLPIYDSRISPEVIHEMLETRRRTDKPIPGIHIVMSPPAMFNRPAGPRMFMYALQERNLKVLPDAVVCESMCDFTSCNPACKYDINWKTAFRMYKRFIYPTILQARNVEYPNKQFPKLKRAAWIKKFGTAAQKARAREASVLRKEDLPPGLSGNIFLKGDEVLCPKEETGFLKPRTIKAVVPYIQASVALQIDSAIKVLKQAFRSSYKINGVTCHFEMGSGKTASELGEWFTNSHDLLDFPDCVFFIFAGDDTFFMANLGGRKIYGEIDFSSFDRTQGVHALMAQYLVLIDLGLDLRSIDFLIDSVIKPYYFEYKPLEIRDVIKTPIQRSTGGPDTTIGNTLTNFLSTLLFLTDSKHLWLESFKELPAYQLSLGFYAKYNSSDSYLGLTFLKGSFFRTDDGNFCWLPLPSQVLKLGKMLNDPGKIFKHADGPMAWAMAAKALACSFGYVPYDYPILGPFLHKLKSFFKGEVILDGIAKSVFIEEHKPFVDKEVRVSDDLDKFLFDRYNITRSDLSDLNDALEFNGQPPILLKQIPLWGKLWFDYR